MGRQQVWRVLAAATLIIAAAGRLSSDPADLHDRVIRELAERGHVVDTRTFHHDTVRVVAGWALIDLAAEPDLPPEDGRADSRPDCLVSSPASTAARLRRGVTDDRSSPEGVGMSHQGFPGWFPECLVCGAGNLPGIVCLSPPEEAHGLIPINACSPGLSMETERDGHVWKQCLLCETLMLADPFSWGSFGYCTDCWNRFAERGLFPPSSAASARRMSAEQWGCGPA
jgi:hypothetical protein